jgi:segregation and condensation protein A
MADGGLEQPAGQPPEAGGFVVDLDGFEGPVDLLLALAREQKVDLAKISILALAEQYLAYIEQARSLELEIAADYLVTAAWLAYLKSRLLLPQPEGDDEPSGEELAEALARRLRLLDAIRRAAQELMERPRLGHERFGRGQPEGLRVRRKSRFRLSLHELLQCYVEHRLAARDHTLTFEPSPVMRVEDAIKRLTRMLGGPDWQNLMAFLPAGPGDERVRRSTLAAHLAASLELTRAGMIEVSQASAFGPIYLRRRR